MSAGSDRHDAAHNPPRHIRPGARARRAAERDEASLVLEAKSGDQDAIEALIRRHWDGAHRAAFLITRDTTAAEDIVQESMLAAVRAIDSFDRRRPLRPWLHRIVVNRALDHVRARGRRGEVSAEALDGDLPAGDTAVDPHSQGVGGELMEALGALDPDQRTVVVLRHLLDYSATEIARMLGVPPPTVRTRLRRALLRLRAVVDNGQKGGSYES